jgi:hypothetical protein
MDAGHRDRRGAVFLDGACRASLDGGVFEVREKATGEVFASAGAAAAKDVDAAVEGGWVGGPAGTPTSKTSPNNAR